MRVLLDELVSVDYGFMTIEPFGGALSPKLSESRGGQRNGLCGAALPGALSFVVGLNTGSVPVRIELHDDAPPPDPDWEDVVEASLTPVEAEPYLLSSFDHAEPLDLPTDRSLRARWSAHGMDEAHQCGAEEGEPPVDRYLLQLWPAPPAADRVVRCGSEEARYWHCVAEQTPPPPTPEERERARIAQEAADQAREEAARRAWDEREETAAWGGRPPSDDLRAWGWRARQLAGQDRDLVDAIAGLDPDQQRALAAWAATRACERAAILDRPGVAAALADIARGATPAAPWTGFGEAWDALFPPEPDDQDDAGAPLSAVVMTISLSPASAARTPLAPEAAAIDAILSAADPHPGTAAAGAVDGLGSGALDRDACFAEALAVVRSLGAR
ncbi:hypothetical protein [Cellulomonas fengjieae]|uniref:Uncharacterized protein n=1 Tax=Cellulomonas fengjieae TaxID=2819978 RepID=A0ABS3SCG1_9CELL|nr:hypothetical protein [Cellulomonas fengjieae]MBO3083014.1 hypothetical protein [Cellulomonas fengjieae]QVI65615.1 hypothetical protein KG102_16200 [Cellulomonas fengjieae]